MTATSLDGIKQSADLLKEENLKEKDPLMIVENGGGNLLPESKATETVELKTHLKEREKVKRRKKIFFLNIYRKSSNRSTPSNRSTLPNISTLCERIEK